MDRIPKRKQAYFTPCILSKSRSIGYRQGSAGMLIVRYGIVSFGILSIDLTIAQMFSVVN